MKRRTASRIPWSVPWGLFGLTVVLHVFALVLGLGGGVVGTVGFLAVTIGFAGVGALVSARTSNRVGWLFLAEGLALPPRAENEPARRPGGELQRDLASYGRRAWSLPAEPFDPEERAGQQVNIA